MPELPEVETQIRDLQILIGRKILEISSNTRKSFTPKFSEFQKKIRNKKILAIYRRGKFLIFTLEGDSKLVIHFRMTGHFLFAKNFTPLEKSIRHFFKLNGGIILQFSDIRKFGTLKFFEKNEKISELEKLGIEPLSRDFTLKKFREILKNRRGKLKSFLLNQTFIGGIGNIYADEICFASRLYPAVQVEKLNDTEIKKLHTAIRAELTKGVRNHGTTIGEYVDIYGQEGRNQFSLFAYRRFGQPCKVCGTKLKKIKINQRTTSFCPKCQLQK